MSGTEFGQFGEIAAYPLSWPAGRERHKGRREWGQFKSTQAKATRQVLDEIERLKFNRAGEYHADIILSTNVELRKDGLPYANRSEPGDPGVAVYFTYKKRPVCFACDKYDRVWKNMVAIAKTIEALRGIARWGTGDMMDRAFEGFAALLHDTAVTGVEGGVIETALWWQVLEFQERPRSYEEVRRRRIDLAKRFHPDGGTEPDGARMAAINAAHLEGRKLLEVSG